ncbi:MAG: hypothetical protein IKI37_08375, partial [Oscillospiraceae bacterium]|nr:hypothetical protein [Oscillospiraceae bacterium]
MKRTLLLFLGMLCFHFFTCTLHAEAETSSLEQIAVHKNTLTVLNGELYGISGEILYQFIPEDNQAKAIGDVPDASLMLSSHGKSLIGLSSSTGTAYCWENNSWKPEVKVDLEELENVQFLDFAVTQRSLFLLLFDFEANSQRIVIIERATGQITEDFVSYGITEIASFGSGTDCIACLCQSKEGKGEYGIVNEKGYYHKTGEMLVPGRGLALENEEIWFHSGDIVYRADAQGITEVMMIRSDPREDNSDAAVLNGHYILLNQGHFPTNANLSDASENKIVMSFFASDDTHEKALQLSGLTCEIRNEMFFYQKQISELLLAQDSLIDIYYIDGAFLDVSPIFSKGYYMPLDSQLLREAVKRMHPSLREMVLQGEKLMALPVLAHPSKYTPVVNLPVLQQAKKLGYNLPETFDEYI